MEIDDRHSRLMSALRGRTALVASVGWGFAEGTLFFIVPDVLFTLTTLASPKRGLQQLGAAVLGAVVAGGIMYAWADGQPAQARAAVAAVPFVGEKLITPTERQWNEDGLRVLFANPIGGVPYKVYAVLAPQHVSRPVFLAASVLMRAERMILTWIVFAPFGWWRRRHGHEAHFRIARLLHAGFWVVVYAVYWSLNP